MTTQKVKIYKQTRIVEKGNKGWLFYYADILGINTISTEKTEEVWISDKKEAKDLFLLNREM